MFNDIVKKALDAKEALKKAQVDMRNAEIELKNILIERGDVELLSIRWDRIRRAERWM